MGDAPNQEGPSKAEDLEGASAPAELARLLSILNLEPIEENLYRGTSPQDGWQRVFGGQVIGQALVAASRTVEGRNAHSLHAYFIRPGDPTVPIVYEVERLRDGRSFTTRRVIAVQHGRPIFAMSASFHIEEPGLEHQVAMPAVPPPETLAPLRDALAPYLDTLHPFVRTFFKRDRLVDLRPVDLKHYTTREPLAPVQDIWVRINGRLPDDPAIHRCALAYASDVTLLDTSLFAHGRPPLDPDLEVASLDHAMWFHRPFRADDWLLYHQDSPTSGGARGYNRGLVFDRAGRLVASAVQEGLIRGD
ncbi:acyl-CoA thioesterase II [Segnochrobactrum spirostomi]|uniref:Acyl-CoA thioesterase 2 n=1 Tax=Segnochrobactrum spirostomi TaxID=2608987 RepID=A0A6A7Y042_9HYPH|nr:acyl-CoA thioesterase II [Segnochrobactrum spirostomi]MQT12440.1 acyl-CoA thioesterase II [Segnochrobactrum spirostomi]